MQYRNGAVCPQIRTENTPAVARIEVRRPLTVCCLLHYSYKHYTGVQQELREFARAESQEGSGGVAVKTYHIQSGHYLFSLILIPPHLCGTQTANLKRCESRRNDLLLRRRPKQRTGGGQNATADDGRDPRRSSCFVLLWRWCAAFALLAHTPNTRLYEIQ